MEAPTYDHAYIEISNDGTVWNRIWENPAEITDSSWKLQSFDVSTLVDNQPTVYIRWAMGPTDNLWHYSGWNIDDVTLIASNVPELVGDFEPDCDVDSFDLKILVNAWLSAPADGNWCLS